MPALRNRKLELLAQELANGKTAEEASRAAGYAEGTSFKANARKRSQDKKVKARVAELRAPGIAKAQEHVAINTEYVLTRAAKIADVDVPADEIKASDVIGALNLIAKVIGAIAPEKHALTDKEGNDLTIMALLQAVDGRTRDLPPHEPSTVPKGS